MVVPAIALPPGKTVNLLIVTGCRSIFFALLYQSHVYGTDYTRCISFTMHMKDIYKPPSPLFFLIVLENSRNSIVQTSDD